MFHCDYYKITILQYYKKGRKEHNPNELQIPNHPFRTLLTENSRSELFNLISHQPDIDKIYLYSENPYKAKHQFLVSKRKGASIKHLKYFDAFTVQIKNVKY